MFSFYLTRTSSSVGSELILGGYDMTYALPSPPSPKRVCLPYHALYTRRHAADPNATIHYVSLLQDVDGRYGYWAITLDSFPLSFSSGTPSSNIAAEDAYAIVDSVRV